MSIQKISTEQLRRMGDQEGLVLQGCGGDLQEWLSIIGDYVNITAAHQEECMDMEME